MGTERNLGPTSRHRGRWVLLGIGLGLLGLLLLRTLVADVYRVETGSMRPTLQAGDGDREWVLVQHGAPRSLRRFDLVVVRDPATSDPLVKRVVGLPGERIALLDGDLLVDGARLDPDAPRPAPVVVFDSELAELSAYFQARTSPPGAWRATERGGLLDARDVERGSDAGLLFFHKPLQDDHINPRGERVVGSSHVGDGVVRLWGTPSVIGPGSELRLRLVEAGDTFEAVWDGGEGSQVEGRWTRLRILRKPGPLGGEVLAQTVVDLPQGVPLALTFANVDNHLSVVAHGPGGGRRLLTATYAENRPHPGLTAQDGRALGPRVALGASGALLEVSRIQVARDLAWLALGTYGVSEPIVLGDDECFVLGDDSAHSRDSRQFGPLPKTSLLGRPRAVLWPWSRARWL